MASVYDYIRAVTLIVGFGYVARQDRKSWLTSDSILWGSYGVALYLCPETMLPLGKDGEVMSFLVRVFASFIIGMESMWYLSRKTRDFNVVGCLLWSRIMTSIALLLMMGYSYTQKSDKFSSRTLFFELVGIVMLFATSVYQLVKGQYQVGGREQTGFVSVLFRLNFLVNFLHGLVNMAFPSWVFPYADMNNMETLMLRMVGGLCFGSSFILWFAPSFRYNQDKVSVFIAETLTMALIFFGLNIAHFKDGMFTPQQVLMMHLGHLPALITILGLYLLWKKDQPTHYSESTYFTRSKVQ